MFFCGFFLAMGIWNELQMITFAQRHVDFLVYNKQKALKSQQKPDFSFALDRMFFKQKRRLFEGWNHSLIDAYEKDDDVNHQTIWLPANEITLLRFDCYFPLSVDCYFPLSVWVFSIQDCASQSSGFSGNAYFRHFFTHQTSRLWSHFYDASE